MAISLAVFAGVALGSAFGQGIPAPVGSVPNVPELVPVPGVQQLPNTSAGKPAPTSWAPFPAAPASPGMKTVPPAPVGTPSLPSIETRTLTYQKPAGDDRPATPPAELYPRPIRPITRGEVPAMPVARTRPAPEPSSYDQEKPTGSVRDKKDDTKKKTDDKDVDNDKLASQSSKTKKVDYLLPDRNKVFRMVDDSTLDTRILDELKKKAKEKFPDRVPINDGNVVYQPKTLTYPPSQVLLEPNYLVHRRLYFEELNSERAGWDAGIIQPIISAMYFYKDVLFWPHNVGSGLARNRYEVSAGKCMPGNPTPYYLYPPGFTVGGSLAETVIITGAAIIIP